MHIRLYFRSESCCCVISHDVAISDCEKGGEWQFALLVVFFGHGDGISAWVRSGIWPFRGVRVGEASNPGPPHKTRTEVALADAALAATQAESDGGATPQSLHVDQFQKNFTNS